MKSVLVIDTPKDCLACPCVKLFTDAEYCSVNMKPLGVHIPKWCPLRPLPKQFTTDEILMAKDVKTAIEMRAYNDCLEEILGEDNG